MHILQLANFYGSTSGGLRVALDELAIRYLAAGAQVTTVIAGKRNRRTVEPSGRTIVEVRARMLPGRMGGYRMIFNQGAVERMIELLDPDVIELSDKTTLAAAATRSTGRAGVDRPPIVLISHERLDDVVQQSFSRRAAVKKAVQAFNQRLGDRVDVIVCCSDYAAQEYSPVSVTPIERIPLGVDLDVFAPGPMPQNARPQVITVVRLTVDKDPKLVVETCRALARRGVDHDWTVYGEGPLRSELTALAEGLPMMFAGFEPDRRRLAAHIAGADVGVSPGPCETFGLAGLELLACGTPAVVPTQGALRELVTPDVGRACERDPDVFADAIEALLAGDQAATRTAARSHAEAFSWEATAQQFLALYERLERSRRGGTNRRSAAA
ncbi:glycosyltransferase [Nodularia spumigena]|uniref:glycosyltransferase n=1 Tax=Nodularia spumigena TaxID=70799 RepID=UPI002B21D425|nr:glycosyltransferase [Nodularia spumigena]MEA5558046.1 glycosyltransferase [Nodularia spumigena CH309]